MKTFSGLTLVSYFVYTLALIAAVTNDKIDSVICLGIAIMCQCWDNRNKLIEINKKIEENDNKQNF